MVAAMQMAEEEVWANPPHLGAGQQEQVAHWTPPTPSESQHSEPQRILNLGPNETRLPIESTVTVAQSALSISADSRSRAECPQLPHPGP